MTFSSTSIICINFKISVQAIPVVCFNVHSMHYMFKFCLIKFQGAPPQSQSPAVGPPSGGPPSGPPSERPTGPPGPSGPPGPHMPPRPQDSSAPRVPTPGQPGQPPMMGQGPPQQVMAISSIQDVSLMTFWCWWSQKYTKLYCDICLEKNCYTTYCSGLWCLKAHFAFSVP